MKIIIHSLDELKELAHLVAFGAIPRDSAPEFEAPYAAFKGAAELALSEAGASLATVERRIDALKAKPPAPEPDRAGEEGFRKIDGDTVVELDASGRPWDEEIDSAAKTKTAKGVWTRSRRRDLTDERYNARVAELIAEQQALDADEADEGEAGEPIATETHALPAAEAAPAGDEEPDATADLTALVEGCRELADSSDGDMRALLDAAKGFIGEYGTGAFDDLKRAVVPDEAGKGKALPALKEPERQLLRACIDNYANFT